jgi:hypothetical protein
MIKIIIYGCRCTVGAVFFAHGRSFHRFDELSQHLLDLVSAALQGLHGKLELVGPVTLAAGFDELCGLLEEPLQGLPVVTLPAEFLGGLGDRLAGKRLLLP